MHQADRGDRREEQKPDMKIAELKIEIWNGDNRPGVGCASVFIATRRLLLSLLEKHRGPLQTPNPPRRSSQEL